VVFVPHEKGDNRGKIPAGKPVKTAV